MTEIAITLLVFGSGTFICMLIYYGLHAIGFYKWLDSFKKKYNTFYQWIMVILVVIPLFLFLGIFSFLLLNGMFTWKESLIGVIIFSSIFFFGYLLRSPKPNEEVEKKE